MNIIVCIKQVPNVAEVRINPDTGTLIREGVPSIINPQDKNAIEEAIRLRDKHGGKITIISMGPPQADDALREALAMGADEAILLTDRLFAGADTQATSYTLACAINKLREFDLIICGSEASDGMTAQVGPQLAEFLHLPQITYARKVEIEEGALKVERKIEDGYEEVETRLPALITVIRETNEPRIAPIDRVMRAFEKDIPLWGASNLDIDKQRIGLKGSPTRIRKATGVVFKRGKVEIIEGSTEEAASTLATKLKERQLI